MVGAKRRILPGETAACRGAKIRLFPGEIAAHRADLVLTVKVGKCSVNTASPVE